MLSTIAVLAILAALLLPALERGRSSAQRVRCVSHLRQLGLAAHLYWDDHAGAAFRWRGAATNGGQIYWFGWLESGREGNRRFDPSLGALFPYLNARGVEVCPALPYQHARFKLKATGAAYGYGYNLALSAPAEASPVSVARLTSPSDTVFLADAAQVNTFQAPASPDNPMLEEFYYVNTSEPTAHFRHGAHAMALFCDGHVSPEKPAPDSLDGRLPGQTIGRLRTEILVIR